MQIDIKTNFDLKTLDVGTINQIGLRNASAEIRGQAQDNAPYQTGKLRQGIGIQPGIITQATKEVRIGPRGIVYAVRREFENFKNPHKKFYMKRAYDSAGDIVKKAFTEAVNLVIKKMK